MKKGLNRAEVANKLAEMIQHGEEFKERNGWSKKLPTAALADELSIFDWWTDWLSLTQLKQMKKFLDTAEKLGYNGYVCFKVGVKGCSNGMWAHKQESETGCSPDGECLYHSFVSGRNSYDCQLKDGSWLGQLLNRRDLTLKEVKEAIANQ